MRRHLIALASLVAGAIATGLACGDFDSETTPAAAVDAGLDAAEPSDATSATDTAPPERNYRWVFVTSKGHTGVFNGPDAGLEGADAFCSNLAIGSLVDGLHWRAWLGTSLRPVNPRDRIADAGTVPYEYRLVTGEVVFPAKYKFLKEPLVPKHMIDRDERGGIVREQEVWTGAAFDGTSYEDVHGHCYDWSSLIELTAEKTFGLTGFTTFPGEPADAAPSINWTVADVGVDRACASEHRLYCFEVDP